MNTGMHPWTLYNHPQIEVLPAKLLNARRAADRRQLSQGVWLARRKRDGRYLAVLREDGLIRPMPGQHRSLRLPSPAEWLHPPCLGGVESSRRLHCLLSTIPGLAVTLDSLPLERHDEPRVLQHAGLDRFGRHLWLNRETARHWQQMRAAARLDGVVLQAVSGYRSWNYQTEIIRRKVERGQSIDAVLRVNALPGFSEHHSGRAIDIAEPGTPPAETSFESTGAFTWLQGFGADFGFRLSYPRGNAAGMIYEPWHWYWQGT